MTMNLRCDDTFVLDEGWYRASERYADFLRRHEGAKILFLDLGTGISTPGIIKYPFWRMTATWENTSYACINLGEAYAPDVSFALTNGAELVRQPLGHFETV